MAKAAKAAKAKAALMDWIDKKCATTAVAHLTINLTKHFADRNKMWMFIWHIDLV